MKLNDKGFTLIEILAVVVIIGLLGIVTINTVINAIDLSKKNTLENLEKSIKVAAKQLYEEVDNGGEVFSFDVTYGKSDNIIVISEGSIEVNLQTLVSNGYLVGVNDESVKKKTVYSPIDNKKIGDCMIKITKGNNNNNKVIYEIQQSGEEKANSGSECPRFE